MTNKFMEQTALLNLNQGYILMSAHKAKSVHSQNYDDY